ncbi:hypothetical protein [Streptomyces sp. NPDC006610]|uniref:hypothetical protein n=1 Tax=Streptomyces sp. NPDC006610 TaxID=3154584 RepID=UPI0033BAA028
MNITPIHCPVSGCFWSAHGIPDQYTEARAWHLAAHRADEHGEPLTDEQIAYATKAGHVIPGSARTTAAAVAAAGALPVPVGNQPRPWDDDRAVQVLSQAGAMCGVCGDEPGDRKCPDCESCRRDYLECLYEEAGWGPTAELRAEIDRLRAERHTTNEALSKADEQAHKDRDRSAELEQQLAERSVNPIAFRVLDGLVTVAAYTTAGQARRHAKFLARREHRGTTTQELLWRADLDEPEGTEWLTEVTAPGYSRLTGFGVTALPLLDLFTETTKEPS